nr:hypothetical protein [Tanacetum cinerariifolium]
MKKELLVALRGELYFVKFIVNPKENDVEPGVVSGQSFLKFTKGSVDFENGIITIYPDIITFNDDSNDELDDLLANINVSDLPPLDITDIPFFMCKAGDGKLHAKIRVVDPYGNIFEQGYKTRPTNRKISEYYKLTDIMSPN